MDAGRPRPRLRSYPGLNDPQQQQLERLDHQQRSKSNISGTGNNGGASGGNGNDSPESGSLYSDEIPSGYNSGEQYDTISTGYMSGEAYELPETRLELHAPSLDVIEECVQPLGNAVSEDNIFRVPTITVGTPVQHMTNANAIIAIEQDEAPSSTSSGAEDNADKDILTTSPILNFGKKSRKKATSFSIPIEQCQHPLDRSGILDDIEGYDESSDPGMGDAPTGGYRAVPSDTDTSAIDSDPNANLNDGRHKRLGRKARKNLKNHDEAWFVANDTKNWARFRFGCFWFSLLCMLIAFVAAGVMIAKMPRNCDPALKWYQGNVILDIYPNNKTDLTNNLDANILEMKATGISGLHLKQSFGQLHPTSQHVKAMKEMFGSEDTIKSFIDKLHANDLSIIVQIPIIDDDNEKSQMSLALEHNVDEAISFWMKLGADGIFLDGLENFKTDKYMAKKIANWQELLERFGTSKRSKILMASYKFAHSLTYNPDIPDEVAQEALDHLNLLDANMNLNQINNITLLEKEMQEITAWDAIDSRPWINWNLQTTLPLSNAAVALQMLLPGTINLNQPLANNNLSIGNMTSLRALAVPIHMNGNYRRCDCAEGNTKEVNYVIRQPLDDIIQLERFYSRRHRYVLVSNFGDNSVNLAPIGKIYSGGELVLDTSHSLPLEDPGSLTKFNQIDLQPGEAIVIKLPK